MRLHLFFILTLTLVSTAVCRAFAPGTIELGVDMSVDYTSVSRTSVLTLNLPDQFRAGLFIFKNTSITGRMATSLVSTDYSHQSANSYTLGMSRHFIEADQRLSAVFEAMGMADFMTGYNRGSQFGIGFGAGFQWIHRFASPRIEFIVEKWFEGEYIAKTTIKLALGLSFYSKK